LRLRQRERARRVGRFGPCGIEGVEPSNSRASGTWGSRENARAGPPSAREVELLVASNAARSTRPPLWQRKLRVRRCRNTRAARVFLAGEHETARRGLHGPGTTIRVFAQQDAGQPNFVMVAFMAGLLRGNQATGDGSRCLHTPACEGR
jgi:hypothetical protein